MGSAAIEATKGKTELVLKVCCASSQTDFCLGVSKQAPHPHLFHNGLGLLESVSRQQELRRLKVSFKRVTQLGYLKSRNNETGADKI